MNDTKRILVTTICSQDYSSETDYGPINLRSNLLFKRAHVVNDV